MKGNVVDYHFFIENFGDTLNHLEKNGRELLEDCKTDKLKFSEAEAEGYLRAIITIKNQFKDDIEYTIHNKK